MRFDFGGIEVVDGDHTRSGKPMLANDPHLELGIPILWYLARITTPELTLTGATAPWARTRAALGESAG